MPATETRPAIVTCVGEGCPVLPFHIVSHRFCPYRSGPEKRAICQLATPAGVYTYEELAAAFGTEFVPGGRTAKEVGKLFGLGKARTLAIEAKALKKILTGFQDEATRSSADIQEVIGEILENLGIRWKPVPQAGVECSGA